MQTHSFIEVSARPSGGRLGFLFTHLGTPGLPEASHTAPKISQSGFVRHPSGFQESQYRWPRAASGIFYRDSRATSACWVLRRAVWGLQWSQHRSNLRKLGCNICPFCHMLGASWGGCPYLSVENQLKSDVSRIVFPDVWRYRRILLKLTSHVSGCIPYIHRLWGVHVETCSSILTRCSIIFN